MELNVTDTNQYPIRIAQIVGKCLAGGVESFVMNYFRNIDRSKIQFDFICDSDSTYIPYEEIESLGGRVLLVPPYQHFLSYVRELRKILKKEKYAIVHSNLNTLSVFPLYAAKKEGVKIRIAHSHSTSNSKEKIKNIAKKILRPLSKKYATHFFACSELAGRFQFGNKLFDSGEVKIINNAIDVERFAYNEEIRSKMRKQLNIENKFVVGHVGRFVSQKNHSFLIEIFEKISKKRDAVLLLLGDGPLLENVKKQVCDLGIEDKVVFSGVSNTPENYYQAMDCFVLPSLYEGFPVVGVEAQANGLPCFFSSTITKEAKILNSLQFIDLSTGANEWSDIIINSAFGRDIDYSSAIANYNIKSEAEKMMKTYLEFLEI